MSLASRSLSGVRALSAFGMQRTLGLRLLTTQASAAPSKGSKTEHPIANEPYNRQRNIMPLGNRYPQVQVDAWVAPNAVVVGDVDIHDRSTVWYNSVLRGDLNNIRIGMWSHVMEGCVIHCAESSPTGLPARTRVGHSSVIGAKSSLRSCSVGNECIIGQRCVIMEGAVVENGAVLEAGTVVPPGRLIPAGQVWGGNPARYVRDVSYEETYEIPKIGEKLTWARDDHEAQFLPYSSAYIQAEALREALYGKKKPSA